MRTEAQQQRDHKDQLEYAQRKIDKLSSRYPSRSGNLSNQLIQERNRGVAHQYIDSIGGHSSNYR
jgi:hypothetical protein